VTWPALFGVFLASHLLGDFLLQTEWQASNKGRGLRGDRESKRALAMHGTVYTLAFAPALVWIGVESSALEAVGIAALIWLPHVLVDDGTAVGAWIRNVKHVHGAPSTVVRVGVDQSAHVLMLALAAFLVTG
jgi:hypothetical protein